MGKYLDRSSAGFRLPYLSVVLSFFLVELFAYCFLILEAGAGKWLILAFGGLWAAILGGVIRLLPAKAGRILYGAVYLVSLVYVVGQTGYYLLFGEMMWISEFLYASEGSDYLDVLLSYPVSWYLSILGLIVLGIGNLWRFPRWQWRPFPAVIALIFAAYCGYIAWILPQQVFLEDSQVKYSGSDYGRARSQEAAYNNMFNVHRLYEVCGLYQTAAKDIYTHGIFPLTPAYVRQQRQQRAEIASYFSQDHDSVAANELTGILEGKNVIVVLMESMDDWMIGTYTPTISRMMAEGINFTNFYTPAYGGIRTFNTEFCVNTGSFLSSQGGYAFDYVTNSYNQSLAHQLKKRGYSPMLFHYNDPGFYSRDVFSKSFGYEDYVYYADYLGDVSEEEAKQLLYDDLLLFNNAELSNVFFRDGNTMNFVITRSAHLSYKYNEVLSHWGLKKYPQFRGLTGNEETDCALLKAKLVDDFFARLLTELEARDALDDTVIIGVTDHYTYGYKNTQSLLTLSGVEKPLLLEKTPCFLWYAGCEPRSVDKLLNTSDLLPTVLNMLGIQAEYDYIGHDAFDDGYTGFVPFPDGSWIAGEIAYDAGAGEYISLTGGKASDGDPMYEEMASRVQAFVATNNRILETDYYK